MNDIVLLRPTQTDRAAAIKMLYAIGFTNFDRDCADAVQHSLTRHEEYPSILVNVAEATIDNTCAEPGGFAGGERHFVTGVGDFIQAVLNEQRTKKVKLANFTAVITGNSVQIGPISLSKEDVTEVYQAL